MTTQTPEATAARHARISSLAIDWAIAKKTLAVAVETEMALRKELFALAFKADLVGTENYELGNGYKLKGVGKINYNVDTAHVDEALAAIENCGNEGKFIAERLISWKPALSLTEYKQLSSEGPYKKLIDKVITTSPATPTLEIVEPKAKK